MQIIPSKQWSLEHRLHRVGDDLPRRQGVEHPAVPHGDPVAHADRVELEGDAARLADALSPHQLHLVQVDVAGDDLDERVAIRRDEPAFPMSASVTPAAFSIGGGAPARILF